MLRLVPCLAALSGCATVWGLYEEDIPTQNCGGYGEGKPLTFTDLPDAANFNIAKPLATQSAFRGSVVATIDGSTFTVVMRSDDGLAWTQSTDALEMMPPSKIGRLVDANEMFVTDINQNTVTFFAFQDTGNQGWFEQSPFVFNEPKATVGNAVRVVDPKTGIEQFRRAMVTQLDADSGKARLVVAQRSAPATDWTNKLERTDSLNTDTNLMELGQAVMTADMNTIVYAAKYKGDATFDLYASTVDSDGGFHEGIKVEGASDPAVDETEPSITDDCKTLYYRRGADGTVVANARF